MKKAVFLALILGLGISSAGAQGLYFDVGLGMGGATTLVDGYNQVKDGDFKNMAFDLGAKFGFGPFGSLPLYVVGVFGTMGHTIFGGDFTMYSSYMIGPGVIYYPLSFIQLAASLGYSFTGNVLKLESLEQLENSKAGFAGDISAAIDLGSGKQGVLIGLKLFLSVNTVDVSEAVKDVAQFNTSYTVFVRYAFRNKPDSSGRKRDRDRNRNRDRDKDDDDDD
jgi:hypothetical protein